MFGQQQPSFGGFGQAQSQPAFGASPASSPFGSTSAFGAQPSPFGAPAGGTGVFGQASQPAFGAASTPAFGAQQSQGGLFGGSAFGAKPAGGFSFGSAPAFGAASTPAFGSAQSSPAFGAFGATSTPAFGAAASTPAFGAAASTPSFGGFGAASTPAFGAASSSPAFGTPGSGAASPFGTPGSAFGAAPASTGFGTPAAAASPGQPGSGSRVVPYQKFQDKEVGSGTTGNVQIFYNSITAMPQYAARSFEELRYEDYAAGVKNGSSAPPPAAAPVGFGAAAPGTSTAPTGFGFGAASSAAGFGASSTGSVFGQASAASPFGASSTPAFGAASPSPFGGGFGASTPASTPAFGGFGASAPATGGGLFGAASTPAVSSPFSFGGAASSGSAFGASSTPAFGAASTPAFGSTGFGAPSSGGGIFGASSTPAFGGSSPFGASSTPAFGTPTSSPFGAPASGGFGAPAASGGFSFSTPAAAAKPAAGGFSFGSGAGGFGAASAGSLFGASSTPAFGTSTGGLFGSTPANTGGSLFGGSAFGAAPATGGGLFGAASTLAAGGSAFSFAPQGGTPGAFGAAGAAPVQPPGVAQQPYGALQPLPQVNVPEQVPVSQRPVRPSVTTTRPSMRLTPRTAMPKFGLGASAGMGRGAAAGKNAAVNSAYVLSGSPGSTDNRAGSPAVAMLLPARDNPHRLFIRSPPPSTAAAANGSSLSPARGQAGVDDNAQTPVRTPQQSRVPRSAERQQDAPASNGLAHTHHHQGSADNKGARKDASPAAAAANGGSGGSPADGEEGGLVPRLGQLREEGYSMRPSERELQALAARDPSALHAVRLVVERQGYGRLEWLQPVDVAGLDLQDIVQIDRGAVAVYFEEHVQKPPVGSGLNKPCRVVLTDVHKKNKPQSDPAVVAAFSSKLKRYCSDMGAKFVSYEPAEGLWTFEVEHFSRYAVPMDSDDDDEEGGVQELDEGGMQVEGSGSGAQGTASQEQEATLGFGSRPTDADMQAEADDADTQQQQQEQFEEPPLQHMLPGLLGHDAGALLEQKGAFFRRGGAAAGSDFEFAAASRRVVDLTDRTREAAAAPPSNAFGRAYGGQAEAGGGRYGGRRPGSAYGSSIQQQQHDGRGGEYFAAGHGQQQQQQSLEHSWVRRRPALLQQAQKQQQQQRALVSLGDDQQQQQGEAAPSTFRLAGAAAGSSLLVRPLSQQELQMQLSKDRAAAGGLAQQQARGAAVVPLLPAATAISSSGAAVDAALMLGRSFRVGWGPTGQLAVPCNPRLNSSSGSSSSSAAGQQQQQQTLLPTVELRQLQPLAAAALPGPTNCSSSSSGSSAAAVAGMQRRVLSGLQLHLDHSQPAEPASAAAAAAPPWQLVCDSEAVVQYVSDQLATINTGASVAAAAAGGGSAAAAAAADAAGCTDHVRQLWLLLQLLFQYIEGQDDDTDSTAAAAGAAANGNADMGEGDMSLVSDGGLGLGLWLEEQMEELGGPLLTGKQYALAAMQRKAALSKWLQQKLRPQVLDALSTLLADSRSHSQQQQREDVLWGVLHLVAGRQLKAAAALAASVGDVRLASLLACVNSPARGRHGQQLLAQVNVWRATSILPNHVRLPRRLLLAVLTAAAGGGEAGATAAALVGVASALGLDWGGALGLWMWYKVPCVESLPSTVSAFTTALATREQLARPVPPYASDPAVLLQPGEAAQHPAFADSSTSSGRGQGFGAAAAAAEEEQQESAAAGKAATAAVVEGEVAAVADSQYALLQLHARGCRNLGTGMLNTAEGDYADVDVDTLVARLLRPAGHTPNPLDYSTAWQLLQVLKALGKLPEDDAEYEVTSSAVASSLIAQLLLLGPEAVPWAAFVALHITNGACREAALQQLLQVTAPTWACDTAAVGWLRDTLDLPPAWLHTAQAVWYTSNHRTALAVLHMVAAGSWKEAHRLACMELLPLLALATIPAGGFSRGSNASSKAGAGGSSNSGGGIAGQVLAVLSDFRAAAAAFLSTVSAAVAVEAEQQAAAGVWRGAEDADDASLAAAADGFSGNARAQAYCVSAAAYVAAACGGAAEAGPAEGAGVALRALCGVLGQQERSLGSGWSLGGGVYASWCGAMLGRSGAYVDPAAAVADAAAEAAAAGGGDGDGASGEAVLQELHASTQRCLWLADLLADAASAVRTTGGKGSWWGVPAAQLTLGGMTATVGWALVRLGVASSKVGAGVQRGSGRVGDGAGGRGLLMLGGDQAAGQMLAAAAAAVSM